MKDKTNTSVELTRAAVKSGKTVAIVGPSGFSIVDYVAGLSEEERNRLTVVEIEDYRRGDFDRAKARLREIIPTAFAVPHELLRIDYRRDPEAK